MRNAIAVLVGAIGIAVAIFVGIVVMLVGGIEQVVDGFNAKPADGSEIAWGVVRVFLAGTVTGLIAWASVGLALVIGDSGSRRRWR